MLTLFAAGQGIRNAGTGGANDGELGRERTMSGRGAIFPRDGPALKNADRRQMPCLLPPGLMDQRLRVARELRLFLWLERVKW
jgi:hypothetical protein